MPRIVGEAKALELILRGIVFDARGALKFGLVHEVVRDSLARALEIAAEIEVAGRRGSPPPNASPARRFPAPFRRASPRSAGASRRCSGRRARWMR